MKRIVLFFVAATVGLLSCDKLKSLADIKFNVPYTDTIEVKGLENSPPIPISGGIRASIPAIPVPTHSEENIREYNTSSELIREVMITQLDLNILQPSSQNFDIADSLWLYMSANGLPDVLAAYYYDIPKGTRDLKLNTTDDNIREYFLKDTIYFRIDGRFYQAPDSNSTVSITTRFDVVANPLEQD